VNTFTENEQELPAIASDNLGNFVVVYESRDFLDEGDEIVGQRFSSAAVAQGDEFLVNTIFSGDQQDPAVGMQPDGRFLVVWESDDGEGIGENSGIFAQIFETNGDRFDDFFRVNELPDENQESPDVGAWSGGFVVTWMSPFVEGVSTEIFARRYNSNGDDLGEEFLVNTIVDLDQRHPAVSVHEDGSFVIVWEDDDLGAIGQEFGADGEREGDHFSIVASERMEEKPRVQVREGGYMATWFGSLSEGEIDNDVFGRNFVVPEPGSALLGLAALSTLGVLARGRQRRA